METIKNNILSMMHSKNLTAYALTKKSNLKIATIQNILYGKSKNPTISVISEIAAALDCSVSDLINEKTIDHTIYVENWNQTLFLSVVKEIADQISKNKKEIPHTEIISLINESYKYALFHNDKKVDVSFCRWLIEKCD